MQVDYLLKVAKLSLFNCAMKLLHIHNAKLHHWVEYSQIYSNWLAISFSIFYFFLF